jgi:hypothetical protein
MNEQLGRPPEQAYAFRGPAIRCMRPAGILATSHTSQGACRFYPWRGMKLYACMNTIQQNESFLKRYLIFLNP